MSQSLDASFGSLGSGEGHLLPELLWFLPALAKTGECAQTHTCAHAAVIAAEPSPLTTQEEQQEVGHAGP